MGKNINTSIWTVDSSGYTQIVHDLFTGENPTYTHAEHIDNSFNFCVNGVSEQNSRMCLHMTNRTDNEYTIDSVPNIFIGDKFYDNRGAYTDRVNNILIGTYGGVSNFAIDPDSGSQPASDFKIQPSFDYRTALWYPRIGFGEYNRSAVTYTYYSLNDLDGVSTAADAEPDETWWEYYTRKSSDYVMTLDTYNDSAYYTGGAFQSNSIVEGQTRFGFVPAWIAWLSEPYYWGYSYGAANCYYYYDNGQYRYSDLTFDVILPLSAEAMTKIDEYDDTWYDTYHNPYPRHVIVYTPKIDKNLVLRLICSYGLPFSFSSSTVDREFADPDYALPIILNNTITGEYVRGADCITADTENNRWVNTKDIDNKPAGGGGGGGGGYDDDPWSGVSFSGVGVGGAGAFAKCYYMTSTELANLRTWMNSNNVPEGFDPMAQIIGLSQVPVSLSGDDNTTVQFVNSSAVYDPGVTRLVDSGVNTQIAMGTPKRYSLGSVNITRRMQERGEPYLDYDCQIELYLPLIGMFSLDTQAVMGRTITAEAVLDPISGTLAAYAYVSRDGQNLPIAYGSTTIGVDLPITAQQYSVARAALKQANAQLGTSLLSSTLSLIAAATAGGKGSGTGAKTATGSSNGLAAAGIREAGADYMKASQAGNVFGDFMQWGRTIRQLSYGNNTAIAGSFGGSSAQWSYPFTPYVKIIRPRYEKPSNYNHSQGVPCVQTKTVGSCTGFIQCIGVDVSSITGATDIELQAIQAALTNGVFAGGGS